MCVMAAVCGAGVCVCGSSVCGGAREGRRWGSIDWCVRLCGTHSAPPIHAPLSRALHAYPRAAQIKAEKAEKAGVVPEPTENTVWHGKAETDYQGGWEGWVWGWEGRG